MYLNVNPYRNKSNWEKYLSEENLSKTSKPLSKNISRLMNVNDKVSFDRYLQ